MTHCGQEVTYRSLLMDEFLSNIFIDCPHSWTAFIQRVILIAIPLSVRPSVRHTLVLCQNVS